MHPVEVKLLLRSAKQQADKLKLVNHMKVLIQTLLLLSTRRPQRLPGVLPMIRPKALPGRANTGFIPRDVDGSILRPLIGLLYQAVAYGSPNEPILGFVLPRWR
jgi:hypothetical protein